MLVTKRLDLVLLGQELTAAQVPHNALGTVSLSEPPGASDLFTYTTAGIPTELPPEAVPVVNAHTAPPRPIEFAESIEVSSVVRTTNDTEMTVFSLPAEIKSVYRAELQMSAMDAGNGACKFVAGILVWKRLLSVNVIAPPNNITILSQINDTAAASWVINGAPQGDSYRIFVKGAAGRTIDWILSGTIARYAPEGLETP